MRHTFLFVSTLAALSAAPLSHATTATTLAVATSTASAASASTPVATKSAVHAPAASKPAETKAGAAGARVEVVADEHGKATQKVIEPTATEKQLDQVTEPTALVRLSKQFEVTQDWRHQAYALERLYALRPMQGTIGYELAAAYARLGDKRKTYDLLVKLQSTGFGFDPGKDARFEKVKGTPVWDYVVLNLQANMNTFGGGALGFTLPKGDTLVESIAYDPARKKFLAASVRNGGIQLVDEKGVAADFIHADAENGLLATYGIAVDAKRDTLWAIGNGVPHRMGLAAADYGRAVLYKFTLSTGKFVARHEVPAAHRPAILSSIAVSPGGDVYVADGVARRIYRLSGTALQMIAENPRLTSIRGMTFNEDGSKLFFADYDLGLFGIELNTGKPFLITPSLGFTMYGIEGLSWWNGYLVIVQNGFPPARVMRLTLNDTQTGVAHAQALDAANPAFATPTSGVVVGDNFWFIANSQRDQYDAYGLPKAEDKIAAVKVFRSDLKFAIDSGKQEPTPVATQVPVKQ